MQDFLGIKNHSAQFLNRNKYVALIAEKYGINVSFDSIPSSDRYVLSKKLYDSLKELTMFFDDLSAAHS